MALKFINEQMRAIEAPYFYGLAPAGTPHPYFVGELTEDEPMTEDGLCESTLIIDGFHRGDYIELERVKEKIRNHFDPICGVSGETKNGYAVAFFAGAFPVPQNDGDLKRIQITIKIKEWKVK